MQLIDIGVNLAHNAFNVDRDQVIKRAVDAGVTTMMVTGTSLKSSHEAQQLARRYPRVLYATAGGVEAAHIAKWNGHAWEKLGTDIGISEDFLGGWHSSVNALQFDANGQLERRGDLLFQKKRSSERRIDAFREHQFRHGFEVVEMARGVG